MYAMMQCKAKSENLAHILGFQIWAVTVIMWIWLERSTLHSTDLGALQ